MMETEIISVVKDTIELASTSLNRTVKLESFLPTSVADPNLISLLLINDGQDLEALGLHSILEELYNRKEISPVLVVGIHACEERKMEYGTKQCVDYKGRGAKAKLYTGFVVEELIPFIQTHYNIPRFREIDFAGFSLGGLSAFDITWNHPEIFSKVGVFSGSLWWRRKAIDDGYDERVDRIVHSQVREAQVSPDLKFFFQTGTEDEAEDRNNNGIIDSIDDTLALIDELESKGYDREKDIVYLEIEGGKHDIPTWSQAMPYFLKWAYGGNLGSRISDL